MTKRMFSAGLVSGRFETNKLCAAFVNRGPLFVVCDLDRQLAIPDTLASRFITCAFPGGRISRPAHMPTF